MNNKLILIHVEVVEPFKKESIGLVRAHLQIEMNYRSSLSWHCQRPQELGWPVATVFPTHPGRQIVDKRG